MFDYFLGKEISKYARENQKLIYMAIFFTILTSILMLVPVYLIQPFIDQGMSPDAETVSLTIPWVTFEGGSIFSWSRTERVIVEDVTPNTLLVIIMLVTFVSGLLKSIFLFMSGLFAAAFSNRAVKSLRIDLFRKFISLPLSFFHKQKSGELLARSTVDLAVLQGNISNVVIGLIEYPFTIIVFAIFLLFMNYKLTLASFFIAPLIYFIFRLLGKKVKKNAVKMQDATATLTSFFHETLQCLKVVYGFSKGAYETEQVRKHAHFLYNRVMHWVRLQLSVSPIMGVAGVIILPGVLIVGKLVFDHTLGEILSIICAFSMLYEPIRKLARINANLRTMQGATERVFEIMNTEPDIVDPPDALTLPRHKESIQFENVSFGYSPSELVLKDISLKINAGEMVAFVGSTGAGKSTLMDLICRFYDVTQGRIVIDGLDIRQVSLASLRQQIGLVSQDIDLFHNTIFHNIAYGLPDIEMERVVKAAKDAYAHDFILAQPQGYDTIVGDQGVSLSGGQRQRIAIARALLIDPAILILDEAASALDAESEICIKNTIESLHGRKTIVMVAHRLSTILMADKIFVLEHGCIVESGSFDKLMLLNGRFRQLYEMQFGNDTED